MYIRSILVILLKLLLHNLAKRSLNSQEQSKNLIYKSLPQDDPKQRKPDITRAQEILNWEPKVNREEGLKLTYEYFKNLPQEELYRTAHRFD